MTTPAPPDQSVQLAVLMACHNRRDKTLACLTALRSAAAQARIHYRLYLFDDGSRDGTAEAVLSAEKDVVLLRGDGTMYWNRSMHAAFAAAMHNEHPAYLWLNDDTMLHKHGLSNILGTCAQAGIAEAIVVGAVCDPGTGRSSYGGSRRDSPRWRPFRAQRVEPDGTPARVDLINGNVVLVPASVAARLGNLDPAFEHAMGDTDYGLRAWRAGETVLQTGEFVGTCPRNDLRGTLRDASAPLRRRIANAFSRKGLPLRSWWTLCRRHGGLLWPLHFGWAYTKVILGRSW